MRHDLDERCILMAEYLISTRNTVRGVAKKFGVSKSTVHRDFVVRLPVIDAFLANDVMAVLQWNKSERHIRGGIATKLKFKGFIS